MQMITHAFLVEIEQENLPGVRMFTKEQLREKIRISLGASDMEAKVKARRDPE